MSWGVALRNSAALGLGGIPSVLNAPPYASVKFNFAETGVLDPRITFTRASSGTYFDSTGTLQTATTNVARFDYNPTTLAPLGLLIEEARTNSCLYSRDLTNIAWVIAANAVITGDSAVAPDGTTTADTITVNGSNNGVFQNIACSSSTAYTFSLWVKLGTMVAGDYKIAIYDNTNAAFIASDIVPTQTPSSTAWTRVTYTFTTPATCVSIRVYCFRNGLAAATSVNVWGMQLEAGAFVTSYVPTTNVALTRAADVATMTGTNFSSWFNQTQGTFYIEYQGVNNVAGATRRAVEIGVSGSTDERYVAGYQTTTSSRILVVDGGVTQADISVTSTQSNIVKLAASYILNNIAQATNGTSGTTDTSATLPTVNQLWFGTAEGSTGNTMLNGYIRSFVYYPKQLPIGELQTLTK
jgi:hypothetical protein